MPETSIQDISDFCREQYEKGMAAFKKANYDYAIELFNQVLKIEPGFFDARQALRATQYKRMSERRGLLKKVFSKASISPALARAQMLARRRPEEALYASEQVLNVEPDNAAAHRALAEAATTADFPRTALLSLEILFKQNPNDKKLVLLLANAYANAGQIARAESLYQGVVKANPHDPELQQALKDLSALRTLVEGGYDKLEDGSGSFRDVLRDKSRSISLEQEGRVVKTADVADRLIEEHRTLLEKEPDNRNALRAIAELYLQQQDYAAALEWYERLRSTLTGSDPELDKTISGIRQRQLESQLASLDPKAPGYGTQKTALESELREFRLNECRERAERYPTDLSIRFDLGKLYFDAGRISEAIQEFQKAQSHPNRRLLSQVYLGRCFSRRGLNDLAVRSLEKALSEKTVFDEEKKEILYELACVLEKMGRTEEAIEQFKQIYEVDIGYKDVGARVDAYYENQMN